MIVEAQKKQRKLSKKIILSTVKQKRAVKLTLENFGLQHPKTQSQILIEAGFSPLTATHAPQTIIQSAGYKSEMERHLSDDLLTRKHLKLLEQKQLNYFTFSKDMEDEEIRAHVEANGVQVIVIRPSDKGKLAFYSIDDAAAIKSGLDMAYKIKGTYAPEKQAIVHAFVLPDEEKKKIDELLFENE